MYCKNCGKQLEDSAKFCSVCGTRTDNAPAAPISPPPRPVVIHAQPQGTSLHPCPKCKGRHVQFQTVTETKETGCMTVLFYIFLAVTILGLLVLIPILLSNKTKTVTYGICQSCGHRWKVK